jgi:hypothetical protein
MAKMWHPQTKEVIQSWIDSLHLEASDELTKWEEDFVDGCQKGLNKYGHLTQAMEETLEKIYADKTK